MKVDLHSWDIEELVRMKNSIELTPVWQRGPAWKRPRQVLLIDSILRDMDIPKVYLRKLAHGIFTHDAVDGQQRLRAIWQFHSGQFELTHPDPLPPIEDEDVHGKKFNQLSPKLKKRFEKFKVSIGEITASTTDEIRNLFARLQMGVSLNPAELRNAMDGPLRYSIDSTARLHPFFTECRISSDRFKHLDYAAHAYAIAAYHGTKDIKAPDLRDMISEYGADRGNEVLKLSSVVDESLDVLRVVNKNLGHSITQKWIFVDLSWLIMQYQADGKLVDLGRLSDRFAQFERLRREYNSKADNLLRAGAHPKVSATLSQHLYDYIGAFKAQGGLKGNLIVRNKALRAFCK
jgi:hypothetical protein